MAKNNFDSVASFEESKELIEFAPINRSDNYRVESAYDDGGFALRDKEIINRYRSAFKSLIGEVGRKLLTGHFNLTTVSLPIRAMDWKSILHAVCSVGTISSRYFSLAA